MWSLQKRIETAKAEIERIKGDSRNHYVPEGEFSSKLRPERVAEVRALRERIRGWEKQIAGADQKPVNFSRSAA